MSLQVHILVSLLPFPGLTETYCIFHNEAPRGVSFYSLNTCLSAAHYYAGVSFKSTERGFHAKQGPWQGLAGGDAVEEKAER